MALIQITEEDLASRLQGEYERGMANGFGLGYREGWEIAGRVGKAKAGDLRQALGLDFEGIEIEQDPATLEVTATWPVTEERKREVYALFGPTEAEREQDVTELSATLRRDLLGIWHKRAFRKKSKRS